MSYQRARSAVPPDNRSFFASVPGVPGWAAVLIAVGGTLFGVYLDSTSGTEHDLTRTFTVLYALSCGVAVVAVQRKALFTALVQPPLILFCAVPLAYLYFSDESLSRQTLILAAIPLVKRFPLMLTVTLVVVAVGAFRLLTTRPSAALTDVVAPRATRARSRTAAPRKPQTTHLSWSSREPRSEYSRQT